MVMIVCEAHHNARLVQQAYLASSAVDVSRYYVMAFSLDVSSAGFVGPEDFKLQLISSLKRSDPLRKTSAFEGGLYGIISL